MLDELLRLVTDAGSLQSRLVLVQGADARRRSEVLSRAAVHFGAQALPLGVDYARRMATVTRRQLPDPLLPEFVTTVQDALSALQRIHVAAGDLKQVQLDDGSPATPDHLLKRFESFIADRCKGRDRSKVRIVVD